MASKLGLAGGIPEWRVRPIWATIHSSQYKAALKLCTSLLAKHPTSPYALALKALITERMGRPDEALSVCLNAMELLCSDSTVHLDDLTLSTLQTVFQRLERLDLATSCYEYASREYPNNLELMIGLFNCHVREYSYVKQQQTAIRMYKTVEEDRFLLWAVCSIQLQVYFTSGGEKLLALAEGLLRKHINSHSLHEPEALVFYISILEQQAKYDAALEVLSGDLGSLMRREEDKLRLQGRLLAQACNYVPASEVYQKVLESCPDDWESFLRYLSCLLEYDVNLPKPSTGEHTCSSCSVDSTVLNKTSLSEELVESRLARGLSFVQKLQENVLGDCVRGPHLANIEIERQHRLNGRTTGRKFIEALVNYFHRFGQLSSSSSDVEIYLHMLSDDEVTELLDTISRSIDATSVSVKALDLTITIFKIQELLGTLLAKSTTDLQCIAKGMVETFCKNLPLSRDLDLQESMHGEELLNMASSILVQLFWRTRNLGYLLEAILVLEFGLTVRKHVWQYKITLVHLYSFLGALPLASRWYESLEVKNILLESFLHHILPQMLSSPFLQQTADLVKDYLRFMNDHLKESADLTCLAYKHCAYSKVIEFVQFKNRLQRSMQYLSVQSDFVILSLKQKAQSLEEVESILESVHNGQRLIDLSKEDNMKQLTFNEDLEARPWWTPTSSVNFMSEHNDQASTPACFRAKVCKHKSTEKDGPKLEDTKRKSLIPRLVYHSIESSIYRLSAGKLWLEKYARSLGYSIDDALGVILDMSSGKKPIKDFTPDIVSWMSFAVFINAMILWPSESMIPRTDQSSPSSWQILDTLLKICIEEQLTDANQILTCPGNNIPVLVQMITEPISWHLIVIQSHMRAMALQGKKKKGGPSERPNMPHLQAIQRSVQCLIDTLRSVQTWLSDQMSPEEQALDILLSNLQGPSDEGPGQIFRVLEENSSAHDSEVGGRIAQSLHTWSCTDVVRRIVGAEHELLAELKKICESKLKLLMSELAVIPVDGPRAGAMLDEKNRDRKKAEDAKTREKEKQKKRENQERDTVLKEFINKAECEMSSKLQKVAEDAEKDFCDILNMVEKEAHNEMSAKLERGIQDAKNEMDARVQKETEKAEQEMLAKIRKLEMEAQEEMVDKIDKAKKKAEKNKMDKLKKARKRAEQERDGKILRAKAELETNNTISEKTENEGRKERKEEDPKTENDAEQDTEFRNADAIDSKNGISVVEDANIKAEGKMDDSSPPTNAWARKPRICSEVSIDPEITKNQNNGVMLRAFVDGYLEEGADMKYYPSLVAIMKLQSSTIFTIDFEHILSKQEYKNLSISLVQGAEQPWVKETIARFFLDKKYHISPTVKFKNNPDWIWSFHEFVCKNKCYQWTATCPDQIFESTFHGKICLSMFINAVVDKHRLNLCFNGQMDLEDLLVLDYIDTKKLMIFTETYQITRKGCQADMAKIWSLCESYYVSKGKMGMLPFDFNILELDLLSVSESAVRT